ncbi:MAG: hypothetical protein NZ108_00790, partial [Bacteroidia bacterium]|nr:hypothetical protein [Bacteroidia bacterium]
MIRLFFWLLCVLTVQRLVGQSDGFRFERLQFLNQKTVSDIRAFCQDNSGYLWIGTGNGLYRFDGINLKTFRNHPEKKRSIPGNRISAIATDGKDRIYVLIQDKGLAYYSRKGDGFTLLPADGKQGNFSESAKLATDLRIDQEGTVWVGVEGGWDCFLPNQNKVISLRLKTPSTEINSVQTSHIDKKGNLWVGLSSEGLIRYKPGKTIIEIQQGTFRHFIDPTGESRYDLNQIFESSNGEIWLAGHSGLLKYIPEEDTFLLQKELTEPINRIEQDYNGRIWFATNNGLWYINSQGKYEQITASIQSPNSLTDNQVQTIYQDRSGTFWIGMKSSIQYLDRFKQQFQWTLFPQNQGDIQSIAFTHDGWVAGNDYGVWLHEDKTTVPIIRNVQVRTILPMKNGLGYWVASTDGLLRFEERPNQLPTSPKNDPENLFFIQTLTTRIAQKYLPNDAKQEKGPLHRAINDICYGADNKIYLATPLGLSCFDPETETFEHFRPDESSNTPSFTFLAAGEKNLIIGSDQGIFRFDYYNKTFRQYKSGSKPEDLRSDEVNCLLVDSKGRLWLGFDSGLDMQVHPDSGFQHIQLSPFVEELPVHALVEDLKGEIWIATNKEIIRYLPAKHAAYFFNEKDGLPLFSYNCAAKDLSGTLYFGGTQGVISFSPEALKKNVRKPRAEFTVCHVLRLDQIPIPFVERLVKAEKDVPILSDTLEFDHYDYQISIEFSAVNLTTPFQSEYLYQLEGEEEGWTRTTRREITFTNLSPGTYILRLRVESSTGMVPASEKRLTIIVHPPFWKTPWFIAFAIIFVSSVIFFVHKARIRSIEKAKEILEAKVEERTKELAVAKQKTEEANEELKSINEELVSTLEQLQQTKNILKEQNLQLEEQKQKLSSQNLILEETNQKLQESNETIKAQQEQLILSEKMAALGTLIASIAHEINNPIAAIKGSLQNVETNLVLTLEQYPVFIKQIPEALYPNFLTVIAEILEKKDPITSREERALRKEIEQQLNQANIPEADSIARTVVTTGLRKEVPAMIALLQSGIDTNQLLTVLEALGKLSNSLVVAGDALQKTEKIVKGLKTYSRTTVNEEMTAADLADSI